MVKVSIIIPVYNVEQWLPACLDSVLSQTIEDIEVICVDDHSPDRSPQILDEYALKDSRVKVIHLPENHRQGFARNRGQEAATGQYLYFLDSDDMITPDAMESLYDLCERDKLDGVLFDSQTIYDSEELRETYQDTYLAEREGEYEDRVYTGLDLYDAFSRQDEWTCYIQRQFWNRDFIIRENIWNAEGVEHEDEFYAFQAMACAKRVRFIREKYFIRRYREDSVMTRKPTAKNFHGYLMNYKLQARFAAERGILDRLCIRNNLFRMYDRVEWLFSQLPRAEIKEWFNTVDEKEIFAEIDIPREYTKYMRKISKETLEEIAKHKHIYIYGAGLVGKKVLAGIGDAKLVIDGFIVTDMQGNPPAVGGHPVMAVNDIDLPEDHLVLVAVGKKILPEVIKTLEEKGINYCVAKREK